MEDLIWGRLYRVTGPDLVPLKTNLMWILERTSGFLVFAFLPLPPTILFIWGCGKLPKGGIANMCLRYHRGAGTSD